MSKSSLLSGGGMFINLVALLIKAVEAEGGEEADIHRLTKPEGEATLKKVAEVIVSNAKMAVTPLERRVPKDGDRAYTMYHGARYSGLLQDMREKAGDWTGWLVPSNPHEDWGWHNYPAQVKKFEEGRSTLTEEQVDNFRGISIGYEENPIWDAEQEMWYAPADPD